MSGIVAAFGNPKLSEIQKMQETIKYRGKYNSGIFQKKDAILGQNYFEVDKGRKGLMDIPVHSPKDSETRICYDGQMGNWKILAQQFGIKDGPYTEERILLTLFKKYEKGMLEYLKDTIFAFIISDGKKLLAARDTLGIKTLFYGYIKNTDTIYFSTELKSLIKVTSDVHEFPPGHYMDNSGQLKKFGQLPALATGNMENEKIDNITQTLVNMIEKSFCRRIELKYKIGCLLSGGLDSSIIASVFNKFNIKNNGSDARISTFSLGVGKSKDLKYAKLMSKYINSEHYEIKATVSEIINILPRVIYYLESFDPSLVRSAVSNFLISRYANSHAHFKDSSKKNIFKQQKETLKALHDNAALRLDRMNSCHSIKVITPFISEELLNFALEIPIKHKIKKMDNGNMIEKWILRKAFEEQLPASITWRTKQEFSKGSGSANVLKNYFNEIISDKEFLEEKRKYPLVRNKEELYYFRIFIKYFGDGNAIQTVGQWNYT
jgi:asparagine synthase (glutamine-hydrolysing)